jgi:hypothetical protein
MVVVVKGAGDGEAGESAEARVKELRGSRRDESQGEDGGWEGRNVAEEKENECQGEEREEKAKGLIKEKSSVGRRERE